MPAASPAAGLPAGARTRRRRRLAAAVRALLPEEARPPGRFARLSALALPLRGRAGLAGPGPGVADPVLAGLRALAGEGGEPAPADADPAELLARLAGPQAIPAEICVALGAALLPLLRHAGRQEADGA